MFTEIINGVKLVFETNGASFSPHSIDRGTLALLSTVDFTKKINGKILDLGCGYGVVDNFNFGGGSFKSNLIVSRIRIP